ncbi:MAG: hypothetical protein LQ345_001301 [Seirophora villosa]|nr:MAG: hypothetical protein LQ345_001301 [Seirophora villosa]
MSSIYNARRTAAGIRKEKQVQLAKTPAQGLAWAENFRQNIAGLPKPSNKTNKTKKAKTGEDTAETDHDRADQHDHELTRAIGSGLACRACQLNHRHCDTQVPACTNCRAKSTEDLCTYDVLQQLSCIDCEKEDSPCDHRLPCGRCIELAKQAECSFIIGARQVVSENGRLTSKYTSPSTAGRMGRRAGRTARYRRTRAPAGGGKERQYSNVASQRNLRKGIRRRGLVPTLRQASIASDEPEVWPSRCATGPNLANLNQPAARKKRQHSDESDTTRPQKSRKRDASLDSDSSYAPSPPKDEAGSSESMPTEYEGESEESQEDIDTLVESTENVTESQESQEDLGMSDALQYE